MVVGLFISPNQEHILKVLYFFEHLKKFIYFERGSTSGERAGRRGERISSRLCTTGAEPDRGLTFMNVRIMT